MKKKHHMILASIIIFLVLTILIILNSDNINLKPSDFKKSLDNLNELHIRYNTTFYSFPINNSKEKLLLEELKYLKNNLTLEQALILYDIRIKLIESDVYFKEGWKHGRGSTTKFGFGCIKGLERLRNATYYRNISSEVGIEAVSLMSELIEKYPEEAFESNITNKYIMFLNATFFKEQKDANYDRRIVEKACVKNLTSEK